MRCVRKTIEGKESTEPQIGAFRKKAPSLSCFFALLSARNFHREGMTAESLGRHPGDASLV